MGETAGKPTALQTWAPPLQSGTPTPEGAHRLQLEGKGGAPPKHGPGTREKPTQEKASMQVREQGETRSAAKVTG